MKRGIYGSWSMEWTREQVLGRSKEPIDGTKNKAFKFSKHGGEEGAIAAAEAWLCQSAKAA